MGLVSSRPDDGAPILVRDQTRLTVTSLRITDSRNRPLYTALPNTLPASRYSVRKESDDDGLIHYVQDPEASSSGAPPNFLLQLENDDDLYFYFVFAMQQPTVSQPAADALPPDTIIKGLTFAFAPTLKELDTLITREFHADPNLHKNPNVDLVGDYSTEGQPREQFEWSWKWRPPKPTEDKGGGWRTACAFVEYDQRAHRLTSLISFSFWVSSAAQGPSSPRSPDVSRSDSLAPPRTRLPSSRSIESRMSDSDTEAAKDSREPPQTIETIPETPASADTGAAANPVKVDLNGASLDGDISNADDGPLFRATIKSLESKTGSVRQRMKKVLKKAEAARDSQTACNASAAAFTEALREASTSNANAVRPALEHYFERIAQEILQYERRNADDLQKLIIDPLARIYGNEIKQADAKKKDFEDESRDYYAFVSRYLGQRQDSMKEKKRAESDSKYENKRKTFELKRFDYSSFMQDLHGGRKDQEVLSQLTKYADSQARSYLSTARTIEAMLPQLEALTHEVREADKQYELLRTGREEKRRALEKSGKANAENAAEFATAGSAVQSSGSGSAAGQRASIAVPATEMDTSLSTTMTASSVATERATSGTASAGNEAMSVNLDPVLASPPRNTSVTTAPGSFTSSDRFKGIRDLESNPEPRSTGQNKEGLLWSLSRPGSHADPRGLNKQAWHKFWVVLDQGRLSEYINWKANPEQHMDPIDLRVASVREARNAERRFCFEVITPHFTRVYQATGEDDMRNWISAINNALQGAFEAKSPNVEPSSASRIGGIAQNLFGKSSSYHGHRTSSSTAYLGAKSVNRHSTVGDRPPLSRSRSSEERPARLLQSIRDSDAGNAWCADCGSDARVEWVSINLGIIICIECSGIHRSLGTHISKVRSLTLDTNAFTQDIVELILSLGNRVSNMVWEAKLEQGLKAPPNASREQRLAFITAKYQQRAYVEPISASFSHYASPDETLLASIKKNDIKGVYYAIALAANTNAADRSRGTHAVFLALVAADPAAPGTTLQSGAAGAPGETGGPRKAFPVAELLVQNGAEIPEQPAPIPLSRSARLYVDFKRAQKLGRTVPTNGTGQGSGMAGSSPAGGKDADSPRRERTLKRSSTGNNVAKLAQKAGMLP